MRRIAVSSLTLGLMVSALAGAATSAVDRSDLTVGKEAARAAGGDLVAVRTASRGFNRKFSMVKDKSLVGRFHRCISIRLSGRIKGYRKILKNPSFMFTEWRGVRIVQPRILVVSKYIRSPYTLCQRRRPLRKFALRQEWKERSCDAGINSVSVGFPWSIGVGLGCEDDNSVARRSSTHGRGSYALQLNGDTVIRYEKKFDPGCTSFVAVARVGVRVYRKIGDGVTSDLVQKRFRVKLPRWRRPGGIPCFE